MRGSTGCFMCKRETAESLSSSAIIIVIAIIVYRLVQLRLLPLLNSPHTANLIIRPHIELLVVTLGRVVRLHPYWSNFSLTISTQVYHCHIPRGERRALLVFASDNICDHATIRTTHWRSYNLGNPNSHPSLPPLCCSIAPGR